MPKFTTMTEPLYDYMEAHRSAEDSLMADLRAETREAMGRMSGMQAAPEQAALLALLVSTLGAREVVEVGTFTGYSALAMARALPADGHLLACDVSEEFTAIARRYWEKAGVDGRIELRLAPAAETLRALPREEYIDFAFIDADKPNYRAYYEEVLARLKPDRLLAIDNVLWGGNVVNDADQSESTQAIRELNDFVAGDARVESVMLPVSDGVTLVRKRGA